MTSLLTGVLVASWLGSLHCAGMCGGIVALATGTAGTNTADASHANAGSSNTVAPPRRHLPVLNRRRWGAHLAYQSGRLLAYSALGAAVGALGSIVNLAGALAGLSELAAITAAFVILAWVVSLVSPARFGRVRWFGVPERLGRVFSSAFAKVARLPQGLRAGLLGTSTGLLPCGWLYGFLLVAAGTGSATRGLLVMASFWLGAVPALLGVGSLAQLLGTRFLRRLPLLGAFTLLVVGSGNVWLRYQAPAPALDTPAPLLPSGAPLESSGSLDRPSCH